MYSPNKSLKSPFKTTRTPAKLAKSPSKLLNTSPSKLLRSPSPTKGRQTMSPMKSTLSSSKTTRGSPTKGGKKTQIWDNKGNLIKRISTHAELEIVHEKFLSVLSQGIYVAWVRLIEFVGQTQEEARIRKRPVPEGDEFIDQTQLFQLII